MVTGSVVSGVNVNQTELEAYPSEPHHEPGKLHEPLGAGPGLNSPACTVPPPEVTTTDSPSTSISAAAQGTS